MSIDRRITSSQRAAAGKCMRYHELAYVHGIRRRGSAKPLRIGAAFHNALDYAAQGMTNDLAMSKALEPYDDNVPVDDERRVEWLTERELTAALMAGYFWRWQNETFEVVATELPFEVPIINPMTNAPMRSHVAAGKIDKIWRLPCGRLAVGEHKTTSESIDIDSDYWMRLRIDAQISVYLQAARQLGYDVETVMYDVVRKPALRLKKNETPVEFGQRVLDDMTSRPDYYFARREIPRIAKDMEEAALDLWHDAKLIHDCDRNGRWPRNTRACLTYGRCPYFELCTNGFTPGQDHLPDQFEVVPDVHAELAVIE